MSLRPAAGDSARAAGPASPSTDDGVATVVGPASSKREDGATGPPVDGDAASSAFDMLHPPRGPDEIGWLAHYRVVRLLGLGGMGMVFQAEDTHLRRLVALKVMKSELAKHPGSRERFLREARAMAALHSDHIVAIHQVGEDRDAPFLAMELLSGESLAAWLKKRGRATTDQALDLGCQIARGLDAAHKTGLIHRDVKPANLWLEETTGRVKILDFGLARAAMDDSQLTRTGMVLGTPAYMAPEQADGAPADARTDLYSLGCVLYEFIAGEPPFTGSSSIAVLKAAALKDPRPLEEVNPATPPALMHLVKRLLSKRPEDRPASASAVVEALQAIAADHAAGKPPAAGASQNVPAPASRPPRRGLWIAVLAVPAGAALLAIVAVIVAQFLRGDQGRPTPKPPRPSTAQGVTDSEILLGMTAPFSGPSRELGREMELGIQTYIHHVNDQGGVAGRKLTLLALDDGYDPDRALANMKQLYEERRVFAVIGNVGTPTAEKTVPYALEKRMLFFGALTGAALLRKDPPDRYVFNYRASYEEETAAILKYLVEIRKIAPDQVAVFAQQDGYGDAGFRGVARTMRKYGRDPGQILRVGHPRNSVDIDGAVQAILDRKEIRAVVMVSTYRPAARFIQKVKTARPDMVLANVSFVGSNALADELRQSGPEFMDGVIVTQVVPDVESQSSAVLKFRELLAKYQPNEQATFIALEGYLDATLLGEGLRRAGDDLTTDSLIDALESIHNLDLGVGAPLNFGPSEHQGSHKVWGTVLDKSGRYQVLELE